MRGTQFLAAAIANPDHPCHYMLTHQPSPRSIKTNPQAQYTGLLNTIILRTSLVIFLHLGIIITNEVKWQQQTTKRCKTTNRVMGFVDRNFKYTKTNNWSSHNPKSKGRVFYGQEPPSGESTTTECEFNYQLLAVIHWSSPMGSSQLQSTTTSYRQWRQRLKIQLTGRTSHPTQGSTPWSPRIAQCNAAANHKTCCTLWAANVRPYAWPTHCLCGHSRYKTPEHTNH